MLMQAWPLLGLRGAGLRIPSNPAPQPPPHQAQEQGHSPGLPASSCPYPTPFPAPCSRGHRLLRGTLPGVCPSKWTLARGGLQKGGLPGRCKAVSTPVHLSENVLLSPSLLRPAPTPLIPNTNPADDLGEARGSEADSDARSLGEPLVKRERSDPNQSLQGI